MLESLDPSIYEPLVPPLLPHDAVGWMLYLALALFVVYLFLADRWGIE